MKNKDNCHNKKHHSKDKLRIFAEKALTAIEKIKEKYPSGISDVTLISEEVRAWIQVKIQQFRECCTKTWFSQKPVW